MRKSSASTQSEALANKLDCYNQSRLFFLFSDPQRKIIERFCRLWGCRDPTPLPDMPQDYLALRHQTGSAFGSKVVF
jgi:hypothetical protein